jgi:hypothetical protein
VYCLEQLNKLKLDVLYQEKNYRTVGVVSILGLSGLVHSWLGRTFRTHCVEPYLGYEQGACVLTARALSKLLHSLDPGYQFAIRRQLVAMTKQNFDWNSC